MDYKSLRPSQILLDPENPRLPDGTSNDKEAINRLLAEGYSQLLALARDLADRGEANPTELPIVIRNGAKYVVLEGNRRFAALKLLNDPRLADDPSHQLAFERLKSKGKQHPKSIYCTVAKDRAEADYWITLRHTGANDGVGVRGWSAEQNARHRRRMRAPVDSGTARSIAIADEVTEAYQADTDLVDLIKKVRAERLTNIGRFFSGVTLTRLQLEIRQIGDSGTRSLWARHTANDLHDYFVWAFQFLDDNSVDAFKNDAVRGNLLNERADIVPDSADSMPDYKRLVDRPYSPTLDEPERTPDPNPSDDTAEADESDVNAGAGTPTAEGSSGDENATTGDSGGDSGRQRDKTPERTLYSSVKLPNLSPNIQRLLREAKQLPINENYATACVLARVILELAVSDPKVLKWSGKKDSDVLASKIRACILKLDPFIENINKRTRGDLSQAHMETNEIGVTYLHSFLHNPLVKADQQLARRFSIAYTPLLNSINGAVK